MEIEIGLNMFYSSGDERRFFQGLNEISAVQDVVGVGRGLVMKLDVRSLNQESLRELIALLWRYQISLEPLSGFAQRKRFAWLNDKHCYWYNSMFGNAQQAKLKS